MDKLLIRDYRHSDETAVLALNRASVQLLSPMDARRLQQLEALASVFWVVEKEQQLLAFLMGFRESVDYDSVNYQWFCQRKDCFLYIDRIVVDDQARSMRVGQQLYQRLEHWAREQGINELVAEINLHPPNHGSLNFHRKQGFIEIGRQHIDMNKRVSMQCKMLGLNA